MSMSYLDYRIKHRQHQQDAGQEKPNTAPSAGSAAGPSASETKAAGKKNSAAGSSFLDFKVNKRNEQIKNGNVQTPQTYSPAPRPASSTVYSSDGAFFPKRNPYEGTTTRRPNPFENVPYSDPLTRAFSQQTGWRDPKSQALYDLAERMQAQKDQSNRKNFAANDPIGQMGRGNIDLYNRPQYRQPDGSLSTVNSISIGTDEGEVLIPTIGRDTKGNPVQWTDDEAIDHYFKTGEYLGKFKTPEEADRYAEALHNQQEAYYSAGGGQQRITPASVFRSGPLADAARGPRSRSVEAEYTAPQYKSDPEAGKYIEQSIRSAQNPFVRNISSHIVPTDGSIIFDGPTGGRDNWMRDYNVRQNVDSDEYRNWQKEINERMALGQDYGRTDYEMSVFNNMTADEQKEYSYRLGKYGRNEADKYLQMVGERVSNRRAAEIVDEVNRDIIPEANGVPTSYIDPDTGETVTLGGSPINTAGRILKRGKLAAQSGLDMFRTGVGDRFTNYVTGRDRITPASPEARASQQIKEDLSGPGRVAYDVVENAAMMLPTTAAAVAASIAMPQAAPAVLSAGAQNSVAAAAAAKIAADAPQIFSVGATMFPMSAGQAYEEALQKGLSPNQARLFATAEGLNQAAGEYLLGGFEDISGGYAKQAVDRVLGDVASDATKSATQQTVARAIQHFLTTPEGRMAFSMGSEAFEEIVQGSVSNALGNVAFGEDNAPISQEDLYSGLVASLSAGLSNARYYATGYANGAGRVYSAEDIRAAANNIITDRAAYQNQAAYDAAMEQRDQMLRQADYVEQGGKLTPLEKSELADAAGGELGEMDRIGRQVKTGRDMQDISDAINTAREIAQTDETKARVDEVSVRAADIAKRRAEGKQVTDAEVGRLVNDTIRATMAAGNERAAAAAEARSRIGFGEQGASVIESSKASGQKLEAMTAAYEEARYNIPRNDVQKQLASSLLSEQEFSAAYQAGIQDRNAFYNNDYSEKIGKIAEKYRPGNMKRGTVTYNGVDMKALETAGDKESRTKYAQMKTIEHFLSGTLGYNVEWFESKTEDGRYTGENGSYTRSKHLIRLDVNAGADVIGDKVKFASVISHELTHTIEDGSPEQYQKLADSVMKMLVADQEYSQGRTAEQIVADMIESNPYVSNEADAIHELVAQACEDMMNGNADVRAMFDGMSEAEQKTIFDHISNLFAAIKNFFDEMLNSKAVQSNRAEAAAIRKAKENIEALQKEWTEGVKQAAAYNAAAYEEAQRQSAERSEQNEQMENVFGDDTGRLTKDADGNVVIAESKDGSKIAYSIKTLPTTQEKLAAVLKRKGYSEESIKAAQDQVQTVADMLTRVSTYYAEMAEALDAELLIDPKTGKTVLHSFVTNGDYPVNIDFLTICKKREAYMHVLTDLIEHGIFDKVAFNGAAIATTNEILRDSGFETACACCFVESRRLQIQRWAETFCSEWNEEVLKRNPNATPFNFSKGERGANDLTQDELIELENELRSVTRKEKNPKGNIKLPNKGARANMGPLLDRIPALAHTLSVGDLITPNGIDSLRATDGNLFSLVKQRYGTATPKITQSFSPYNGDVADLNYGFMRTEIHESIPGSKKYKAYARRELAREGIKKPTAQQVEDRALRKYLYDIGGVRLQSFSDFLVENTLDYFQMFADLAAKELPLHAYSKEISFIKMFGMTGGKMNMSLIPVVDLATDKEHAGLKKNKDGTYSYAGWGDYEHHLMIDNRSFIQSIGFKDAIALQLHPGYSSHIGTIAIGISNAHIRKMLNDPLIRMVIPYHSSGMLPEFAKQMHIDYYHDYTTTQNTTLGRCTDMSGNEVETYNLKGNDSYKCDTHYDFNEAFQRLGDAREACEEYKAWCRERHPVYKGSTQVGWAEFTPKFDEFKDEPNYYKLIEDFNSYDCITEEAAVQGAVTMSFPGMEQNLLNDEELKAYEDRLRATGQFTEKEIQKYVSRANETLEDIVTREAKNRNAYHREMDKKYDSTLNKIEAALQRDYNKADYDLVNNKYVRRDGEQRSARYDALDEKQKKNYQYNEKQDIVGGTLKTLKGSTIKRSKYGVGKEIGGQFYFNKEYASDIIPDAELNQAISILAEEYPGFQYNCMMYQPSKNVVRFDEAADFDTAREPMTGDYVSVNLESGEAKTGHSNYIWHHKWLWVKNDYKGFDVEEAWNWSKTWLNTLTEVADGNGIGRWNAQLDRFGLPHDGDTQYSGRLTRGQKYTGEDTSVLQIPGTFTHFEFPAGTRILDYGGGQFNFAKEAVERTYPGVTVEVMDAFNRTSKHNNRISDEFDKNKADAVTVNNVLNVIDSRDARIGVIEQAKRYLKDDGVAYFLMYQADKKAEFGEAKGSQKDESRRNYQTNMDQRAYIPEIKEVFDYVTEVRSGGDIYLLASNIPLTKDMYRLSDQNSEQVKYLRSIKGDKEEKAKYNTLSQRYGEATVEILDSEYENAANTVLKNGEVGDTATIKKIVDHLAVRENLDKKTVRDLYKIKRDANGNVIPLSQRVEIHDENIRYSSRDNSYMKAVQSNDMETADRLVKEAAADAGYTEELYHGTGAFGFTMFDLGKMDDGASIFATTDSRVAESYSGETKRELISQRGGESTDAIIDRIDGAKDEDLLPLIKENLDPKYKRVPQERLAEMRDERVNDIRFYADKIMDFMDDNPGMFDEAKSIAASRLASSMYKLSRARSADEVDEYLRQYNDDVWELKFMDEDAFYEMFDGSSGIAATNNAIRELNTLLESDVMFTNGEKKPGSTLDVLTPGEARTRLIGEMSKGIYHLYGKNENMLEFDANGDNWNMIDTARISNKAFRIKSTSNKDKAWLSGLYMPFNDAQSLAARAARDVNGEDDYLDVKDLRDPLGRISGWEFRSHKTGDMVMELESALPSRAMTRDIAKYAREVGYDGVIMRNLKDSGGATAYNQPSDVYIYFKPNAVKSADTVTYDDDGNIIPLSERFSSANEDIRYSNRDTTGKQLTKGQQEYFKDSKARDAEGRLLTLYHGTEFAGFTEFKTERGVWLTTSKRDADSYGGNWEGKVFDPNEKPEIRRTNGKTYPVGEHMRFETEEDRDNFLKEYPDAESYLTERELRVKEAELEDDWEADDYDERSEELQELRKRSEKIGRAYARYELKHSGSTTIGEMLEDPSLYSLNDFKRVWLSIDREVSFDDEFEYYDSDEEYRDAIAERLRNYIEEGADDQEWHDEMLNDFAVKARIPEGKAGEIFNNTNNRTYELYANVVNPYVFDNHGRGSEFNGTFYHTIEEAMADPQYDGVIVENARVGRYQDLGTVVLVKNPNQVKLTSNENPTESNDVRFSARNTTPAPTFYSKLQREVENFKGNKIGAASVESYLKGKGVKDEEIKWSGIRTFLEGKKSVDKAELLQYLRENELQIEETVSGGELSWYDDLNATPFKSKEDAIAAIDDYLEYVNEDLTDDEKLTRDDLDIRITDDRVLVKNDYEIVIDARAKYEDTNWSEYKLDGGTNYREVLFSIPNSDYSNQAMQVHWRGKTGVLAHARIQDFETEDGGKVLFVEEIQSDWHNAGQKYGYDDFDVSEKDAEVRFEGGFYELYVNGKDTHTGFSPTYMESVGISEKDVKKALIDDYRNTMRLQGNERVAPDAPYRTTYTDYVLKNLLRMAAEGDYDYLAWTTGKMQEERWSDEFAEGYRIEYDQQIPKFLKKYGKQWGAGLTTITIESDNGDEVPAISVNELMKQSVLTEGQPRFSARENGFGRNASFGTVEELERRNENIREMNYELDAVLQNRGTQTRKLSDQQIERIARRFLREYSSKADVETITNGLKSMYEYIDNTAKISAQQVGKIANSFAEQILDESKEVDDNMAQMYPELAADIKRTKLYVSPETMKEMAYYFENAADFRRQAKKFVTISEQRDGARGIDTFYEELSGNFPELFDSEIVNEKDQLLQIMDVAEQLKKKTVSKDWGSEYDEIAYTLGQDMVAAYFAEKGDGTHKRNIDMIKAQMKAEHREYVDGLRRAKERQIQELKDKLTGERRQNIAKIAELRAKLNAQFRERQDKAELRRLTTQAKARLQKNARDLWGKRGTPEFEKLKAKLFSELDLVSVGISRAGVLNLEKTYNDAVRQAALDSDYAASDEYKNIELKYHGNKDNPSIERKKLRDLSYEEIVSLTEDILALKHSQQTYNRLMKDNFKATVAEYGRKGVAQQNIVTGILNQNGFRANALAAAKKYALYMENPVRAAHLLDGYQEDGVLTELFNDINDGTTKKTRFQQKTHEMFEEVLNDKELMDGWSDQNIEIEVRGQKYHISKGMRIAIALHAMNTDNIKHIEKGGFNIPNERYYKQGRYTDAYNSGTRVWMSKEDMDRIAAGMTEGEKRFAQIAWNFFNKTAKDAINETSLILKGYELAVVPNYFPIRTDKNFTQAEIDGLVHDGTIEGQGQFKDRKPGAKNPILLEDVALVIDRQTQTTGAYYGIAIPVRDMNKVWNYTATAYAASMKDSIARNWGEIGKQTIEKTIRDIQMGARRGDTGDHIFSFLKGAYAASTLVGNIGVSIKQAASYPLAISMIDADCLAKGLTMKTDRAYMDSITPWSWDRRHGMGGEEMSDILKQKGMIARNQAAQNVKNFFNLIQKVDVLTTDHLFSACEAQIQKDHPKLEVRGEEYNKKVAELYNEMLWRTQPSYGVMQRNELMRSSSSLMKALTMFKTQTFNMGGEILDAALRAQAMNEMSKNGLVSKAEAKRAAKALGKVMWATVLSQATLAAMTALANAVLRKMRPYRDDKGEVTGASVARKVGTDFVTSWFGLFFGADLAEQGIAAVLNFAQWYDITAPQFDRLNDTVSDLSAWTRALIDRATETDEGKKAERNAKVVKTTAKVAISATGAIGIPAQNIYNMLNAVNLLLQDTSKDGSGFLSFEAGSGLLGLTDTAPTKEQYARQAVYYSERDDSEKVAHALQGTNKSNLEKVLGSKLSKNLYESFLDDPENLAKYMNVKHGGSAPKITDVPDEGYESFTKLREAIGDPERTQNWHHIVEQEQGPGKDNYGNFSPAQINNKNNIVSIPSGAKSPHSAISQYYDSVQDFTGGKTVREWLSTKSFEEQFDFGVKQLQKYGDIIPTGNGWVFVPDDEKIEAAMPLKKGTPDVRTEVQKQWETRMAELREDGGLSGREVRDAALTMIRDGLSADEALELYRQNQKSDKMVGKWKGSFEDYLNGRNAIDDAKAIKDSDKKRQKEKRREAVEDYLRQYHGTEEDELLLWELMGYGKSTFDFNKYK